MWANFLANNHRIHLNFQSISFVIEIPGIFYFLPFIIVINNYVFLFSKILEVKENKPGSYSLSYLLQQITVSVTVPFWRMNVWIVVHGYVTDTKEIQVWLKKNCEL